ncbi:MAG: response regulator [Pedobacter sp.]|nr:MAG: response regulator [Pedobacter sp.]
MKNLIDQKIFLVDDDELSRAYYVQHLKNLGYTNLFEFQNGSECINHLIDSPDIIFLDQNMANMNGLDVLKKIKNKEL